MYIIYLFIYLEVHEQPNSVCLKVGYGLRAAMFAGEMVMERCRGPRDPAYFRSPRLNARLGLRTSTSCWKRCGCRVSACSLPARSYRETPRYRGWGVDVGERSL